MYQMILRISDDMKERLKNEANERGQTLTGLIRQILWEWADVCQERRTNDFR